MFYSYEEEIARLRQQLEQAQGRAGNGNVPTASTPTHRSQAPHTPSMHQSTGSPVPPPPNLGPSSSNYFGDIMSTSSGSGSAPTTAAATVATSQPPPPHEQQQQQQQQYSGYPPYHHQQQHPPPPTSMGYTNGSSPRISAPPHSSHVPQGMDRYLHAHTHIYIHDDLTYDS